MQSFIGPILKSQTIFLIEKDIFTGIRLTGIHYG